MRIVEDLIEDNLVKEIGQIEYSGGRPRTMIGLNTEDLLAVSVDMSGDTINGAVTNLNGDILYDENITCGNLMGEEAYKEVCILIEKLISKGKTYKKTIKGIGIGVPGVTEHITGKVIFAPCLDWKEMKLKDRLEDEFNMPVVVDNDVNMAALGELWFGRGQGASNMVLMNIDTGVGMGIILNNALYRGSNEAAGEIGYMIPEKAMLNDNYPEFGALEYLIGGMGIENQARQALKESVDDIKLKKIKCKDVFDACRDNEDWACRIIDNFIGYLSMAVITASAILNPEVFIISGEISKWGDVFIDKLNENIKGKLPNTPRIEISKLNKKAYVLGTTIKLLHNTSNYYTVQELS